MRLIDADAEIEKIKNEMQCIERKIKNWEENRADRSGGFDVDKKIKQLNDNILHAKYEIKILNGYKTAYDVDKVIKEIQMQCKQAEEDNKIGAAIAHVIDIEIVKEGGLCEPKHKESKSNRERKKISKFDYMEFGYDAGSFDQLVFHAKKYTKEQAVEIFNTEYAYKGLKCTADNIDTGYVKYYIRPNQFMSQDFDGGCYGFTDKPGRGAFPVWVITLADLELI